MFSALKKLTRNSDDRCPAPVPMSSSLQKKFSKGVNFNMKILIKGDRNVGKSCLLQRLQGGAFIEEYVPTDQIQVAPIHWTYKNSDYIVKVEVWEVVDKGRTKKKPPLGLKLENQTAPTATEDGYDTPVLDATFLDVYKNANGVILMLDITKPWTFEYVVKEMTSVPADVPIIILGNHCDMQHHRQVHSHHIEQALQHAEQTRSAPVRYAESSMRNGFGLRLLHKFLSVPFLRLQKTMLLEQLQRNQKDIEETEMELDDYQNSEESHYNLFVDRLADKRRQSSGQAEARVSNDRSPSIVLGAGKPIVPPNVNPLLAQTWNPANVSRSQQSPDVSQIKQSQFVSSELLKPKHSVSMDMTPSRQPLQDSGPSTPSGANVTASSALDEFYAGTLDSSFLEDLTPLSNSNHDANYESDSDEGSSNNPMVTFDQDDLEVETAAESKLGMKFGTNRAIPNNEDENLRETFLNQATIRQDKTSDKRGINSLLGSDHDVQMKHDDFPLWAGDFSARRSPEGGEDPDVAKESNEKDEKKQKKKKSKDKDRGDSNEKAEKKEKKNKHRKSKGEKSNSNAQRDLLASEGMAEFNYEEYDSI